MRMRRLGLAMLLALWLLSRGHHPVGAAEPLGPFCMTLDVFADRLEVFALPNGGGQFLLSVRNVNFPDAYVGSAVVSGTELIFTFAPTGRHPALEDHHEQEGCRPT
jgi:hypothetical protein